jgi:predicted RNA binding protein YcfA (HicA-like mRNA interferase family)
MPPRDFELDIRAIRRRLEADGWRVKKARGDHEVYAHPHRTGRIPVPRGRGDLPFGTAKSIAEAAGWTGARGRQE